MKKIFLNLAVVLVFSSLCMVRALADDLDALAGKWVAEGSNPQGDAVKQVLVFKDKKFTFEIQRENGRVAIHAEGDVKTERLGPFKTAKFFNIQGGNSASDLQPVDDERTVFYTLDGAELTVGQNFDKEREQPPTVTKFTKQAATEATRTLVIDKIVMHKTPQTAEWYFCFDATVGETTKRFHIDNKTWNKDEVTITTNLEISNVRKDQSCKFVMKLDDVAGDECTEEMDNKSAGSFSITDSGVQEFKPEDQWSYAIHWHLK